jgi:hypothetical protein
VIEERLDRSRYVGPRPLDHSADALAGHVRILLGPGQRELLADDPLVQDEPRVVVPGVHDVPQRAQRVEPREARSRQPVAQGIDPQGRRAGQDPDAVVVPDRRPVVEALGVVPHPVRVDQVPAALLSDLEHPAVDMGRYSGHHRPWRLAEPVRPGLADQIVVAADPAGRDDHGLRV